MDKEQMTLAEIHADVLDYLSGDCTDPIGYLETLELRLSRAINEHLAKGAT